MDPEARPLAQLGRQAVPRPPYLTDEWLADHGIRDVAPFLAHLRTEDEVTRPAALRAAKATRLSFARSLVARMIRERWQIDLASIDVDADGAGRATYEIEANGVRMHLGVASFAPARFERAGRIADDAFDFLGVLLDGPLDRPRVERELDELSTNLWTGRTNNRAYGWTAANRSNRFFDHTVERLSEGLQPDIDVLASGGGYIIRNAGWHGNGRFGSRTWLSYRAGHPFSYPYHIDMFPLYLFRTVGFDFAEAAARRRDPARAVPLDAQLKRILGIGNSSGVGMVAALVRWPAWMSAYHVPREVALAYALSRPAPIEHAAVARLTELLERAAAYYAEQPDCPVPQITRPEELAAGLRELAGVGATFDGRRVAGVDEPRPWAALARLAARHGSLELREQLNAILVELHPAMSDAAAGLFPEAMKIRRAIQPAMSIGRLRELVATRYDWALAIDQSAPGARTWFWYRSEDHGENRRGERDIDPGVENETFVDVVGAIHALWRALADVPDERSVGRFLVSSPQHSHIVSRVQLAAAVPYSEIRGNIIDRDFLPMDGIRFLLSMMGLECSHPHNTRWVRGVFLQGAPTPEDIRAGRGEDWIFPTFRGSSAEALVASEAG